MTHRATYSVDDNKIRIYSSSRLDKETYDRVKAAGFKWAPKQEIFVAPMWTPEREDIAIELAGEIEDEDTSLVERAEERADRFEDYSDKRQADGDAAYAAKNRIAEHIPFGQPILVGHHSEGRARRDADRIWNNMGKAVKNWGASEYWANRAEAAKKHAAYKERPDVRARRIKGLEADLRKVQKQRNESEANLKRWKVVQVKETPEDKLTLAESIANYYDHLSFCFTLAEYPRPQGVSQYEGSMSLWSALREGIIGPDKAAELAIGSHERYLERSQRWVDHYEYRLCYERAMLEESGGTVADRTGPEVGGAVQCWASPRGGWSYIVKVNKVSVTVKEQANYGGSIYTRTMPFDKLKAVISKGQVDVLREAGRVVDVAGGTGFLVKSEEVEQAAE